MTERRLMHRRRRRPQRAIKRTTAAGNGPGANAAAIGVVPTPANTPAVTSSTARPMHRRHLIIFHLTAAQATDGPTPRLHDSQFAELEN